MRNQTRRRTARTMLICSLVGMIVGGAPVLVSAGPVVAAPTTFVAVTPARLLDTRLAAAAAAGTVTVLDVAGRGGVTADASAAALNVTATGAVAAGFVTVWPCGTQMPTTSSLNFTAGRDVANAALAKLGINGQICLYTEQATHLIVDVTGYFPTGSAFAPLTPARLADSRPDAATIDSISAGSGLSTSWKINVAGRGGVPSTGVEAAALNVTVTAPTGDGFLTVYPCETLPVASNLNFTAGQTIANSVVTKLDTSGDVCVKASIATHLIVDVVGSFQTGSITAYTAYRRVDTRPHPVPANSMRTWDLAGNGPVWAHADAVVLNVTVVSPEADGFITVYPCGTRPESSTLNYRAGQDVANLAVTALDPWAVCVYTSATTHIIIDVTAHFGGNPPPPPVPPFPPNDGPYNIKYLHATCDTDGRLRYGFSIEPKPGVKFNTVTVDPHTHLITYTVFSPDPGIGSWSIPMPEGQTCGMVYTPASTLVTINGTTYRVEHGSIPYWFSQY